jgi:hypothetical protein
MSREVFNKRLPWCLKMVEGRMINAQLAEMLLTRAVQDRQMMSAYDAFRNVLQSDRFSEAHQFIQDELERLAKCSTFFNRPKGVMVPRILSEWESVWIGSLHELAGTIGAQLEAAEKRLVELQKFLDLGRTEIEPYLLWSTHLSIAEAIRGMKPRISAYRLLVAYAHASELIPYRRSADRRANDQVYPQCFSYDVTTRPGKLHRTRSEASALFAGHGLPTRGQVQCPAQLGTRGFGELKSKFGV